MCCQSIQEMGLLYQINSDAEQKKNVLDGSGSKKDQFWNDIFFKIYDRLGIFYLM